jgi:hypothetical protein
MTIALGQVGSGAYTDLVGGSSGNITLTWGGTTTTNSVLLAFIVVEDTTNTTFTVPTAWNGSLLSGAPWNDGINETFLYGWLLSGAAAQSGGQLFQSGVFPCTMNGVLLELVGTATSSAQDGSTTTANGSGSSSIAGAAITISNATDAIISVVAQASTASSSSGITYSAAGGGFAIQKQASSFEASGAGCPGRSGLAILTQIPGANGTYTPSLTSTRIDPFFSVSLAIKAAAVAVVLPRPAQFFWPPVEPYQTEE